MYSNPWFSNPQELQVVEREQHIHHSISARSPRVAAKHSTVNMKRRELSIRLFNRILATMISRPNLVYMVIPLSVNVMESGEENRVSFAHSISNFVS